MESYAFEYAMGLIAWGSVVVSNACSVECLEFCCGINAWGSVAEFNAWESVVELYALGYAVR